MRHLIRRFVFYAFAVWVAVTLDFFIPRLAPGDPVAAIVGKMSLKGHVTPQIRATLAAMFGLDTGDPLWVQYFKYLGNLLHGNFGNSLQYFPTPVSQIIAQNIWLSVLSIYVFAYSLYWFPLSGGYDEANINPGLSFEFISSVIYYAFLPALTLVISSLAGWMLTMRNSMLTTLSEDYVLMARAKGLKERRVMFWYAARNAVLPNITGFAIAFGTIVGGQMLTEMVFSYPGIGYALLQAVTGQDYAMVQSIFLIITLAVLGANFLADMLYALLDPRVRQERSI